jgi:hypothetical protein
MEPADERAAAQASAPRFGAYFRVRHYEAHALGHVNNAAYLHYLEQASIEHSAAVGYLLRRYQEMGTLFIVRLVVRRAGRWATAARASRTDRSVHGAWDYRPGGRRSQPVALKRGVPTPCVG